MLGLLAGLGAGAVLWFAGPAVAHGAVDARVTGTFTMRARVTVAVNVRGEQPGQRLTRRWTIAPRRCSRNVCRTLVLTRRRAAGRRSRLTLHRVGRGRYAGAGVFFAALACDGRVYRDGARVPYRITLTVTRASKIGGIRFARRLRATYVNAGRTDSTPCSLGPSHDAATYRGRLVAGLPVAPVARFTDQVAANGIATFTDTSTPGRGGGRRGGRIVAWAWDFGDPGSPYGDTSPLQNPAHVYTRPGTYQVLLTVTDAAGLTTTTSLPVIVPPLVPPATVPPAVTPAARTRSSPARRATRRRAPAAARSPGRSPRTGSTAARPR